MTERTRKQVFIDLRDLLEPLQEISKAMEAKTGERIGINFLVRQAVREWIGKVKNEEWRENNESAEG